MSRSRFAFAAVAALATAGVLAAPAAAENLYTVNGSGPTGGTPSKPKPAALKETFSIASSLGASIVPDVVARYSISVEGGRLNGPARASLAKCKLQAESDPDQSDEACALGSVLGSGKLSAAVGVPGQAITPAYVCTLPFNLYNTDGGDIGLFINATSDVCVIPIKKWIRIKVSQVGRTVVNTFDVPETLQQPITGTFSPVLTASFTLNKRIVTVGGKKAAVAEAIGCGSKKVRKISVRFTERSGRTVTASKQLPC